MDDPYKHWLHGQTIARVVCVCCWLSERGEIPRLFGVNPRHLGSWVAAWSNRLTMTWPWVTTILHHNWNASLRNGLVVGGIHYVIWHPYRVAKGAPKTQHLIRKEFKIWEVWRYFRCSEVEQDVAVRKVFREAVALWIKQPAYANTTVKVFLARRLELCILETPIEHTTRSLEWKSSCIEFPRLLTYVSILKDPKGQNDTNFKII